MFRIMILTLFSHLRFARSNFRTCVPNTQFILNDRMCYCDGKGQWSDDSCLHISHSEICQPGRIVWHRCSQCICQENGQLLCNMVSCADESPNTKGIQSIGAWCIPFRIYYVDCNICVCPETARTANVNCIKDPACTALRSPSISDLLTSKKNSCKPKVLYLFSCLQCLCSDEGFFVVSNCVETCPTKPRAGLSRACTPQTLYRSDCNVCLCPNNGIHNDTACTQQICEGKHKFKSLSTMKSEVKKCTTNQFTPIQCVYCHCNPGGTINQEACLELSCLEIRSIEYDVNKSSCGPGEMVPFCTQCFCLRNGTTQFQYCAEGCSYRNKVDVLEKVLTDSKNSQLINWTAIARSSSALKCEPDSIFTEGGKICLCPDGETKEKTCIMVSEKRFDFQNPAFDFRESIINIDFKRPCEPSTFVTFDCNSCFCSKNGTIDPKWCTYDDCNAKWKFRDTDKEGNANKAKEKGDIQCTPGTITKLNCNLCICPDSGKVELGACTKNPCSGAEPENLNENFNCDPLEYYEVDCNTCLCPRDGKKNVDKCTKNVCEDNILRADICVPVKLFSHECNICICPPDGNKEDKICTKHDCQNSDWKKIAKLTHSILWDVPEASSITNKLGLCLPGEEFIEGDKLCMCPEMGLRSYATCSDVALEEETVNTTTEKKKTVELKINVTYGVGGSFSGNNTC